MKNKFLSFFLLLIPLLGSVPAFALDTPLLTWEQGKSQSVVLGGPTAGQAWKVELVSENLNYRASFSSSRLNKNGFRVYSINLPNQLPQGNYVIETVGKGSKPSVVAQVIVVKQNIYEVTRAPLDLLAILVFLGFLIASVSFFRQIRLLHIYFHDFFHDLRRLIFGNELGEGGNYKFKNSEVRRIKLLELIPESLLKINLEADSNFLFYWRRSALSILPIASIIFASVFFLLNLQDFPNSQVLSFTILAILTGIGIVDIFSGAIAGIVYLALTILFLENISIHIILQTLFELMCFIVPGILLVIAELARKAQGSKIIVSYWLLASLMFPFFAISVLRSLNDDLKIGIVGHLVLFISNLLLILKKRDKLAEFFKLSLEKQSDDVNFTVSRVMSPAVTLMVFIVLLSLFMNWTRNFNWAFWSGLLWALPLFLSCIRFDTVSNRLFAKLKRNIPIEAAFIGGGIILIFFLFQQIPWLVEDRSQALLVISSGPVLIHALYVTIVESKNEEFRKA